jgi:hypothetical protein
LGINTQSPLGLLEISTSNVKTSVNGGADELILQNDGYCGMTIFSNSTSAGQIIFGDETSDVAGAIQYFNSDDSLRFKTNATEAARFDSNGNFIFASTAYGANTSEDYFRIKFEDVGGTANDIGIGQSASGSMDFNINPSGSFIWSRGTSGEAMRLTSIGLGIGGTPNELLQIDGTSPKIRLRDTDASGTPYAHFDASDGNILLSADAGNEIASSNIQFAIDGTEAARFDSNGNFSIANTATMSSSNAERLIIGNGSGAEGITIFSGSDNGGFLHFADGTTGDQSYRGIIQYSHPLESFIFRTEGTTERMRLNSTGLGIGGTPSAKLHLKNTSADTKLLIETAGGNDAILELKAPEAGGAQNHIRFSDDTANVGGITYNHNSGGSDYMQFYTAGTEAMRIDSSGNVGIGTTSPDSKIEISGTDSSTTDTFGLKISNEDITTNSNGGILFKNYDNHGAWIRSIRTGSANGKLSFGTNSGAGIAESNISERMVIDHNGNVGIGNTNPSAQLTIHDGSPGQLLFHTDEEDNQTKFYGFNDQTGNGCWEFINAGTWNQTRFYIQDANNADTRLTLDIKGNNGATDIIAATSSGKVGIGGAPDKTFHIKTTAINTAFARIESTATNSYPTLSLKNDAREYQLTAHGGVSDSFVIYDGTVGANRFFINTDGDIIQNFINYTDLSNYEALKISAESDHIKYDTTSIGSFASNVRDHRFYVNGTQRFYVTNSGAWTTGNFYINGSGALRQASDHLYLSTSTQTNNDIIFKPANTEAVRIGSNGVIDFSFANSTVKLFESANNDVRFGTNTSDAFSLIQNGSRRLLIAATGKVGIASNDPSANADLTLGGGELCMAETTTPTADANFGKIYCKSDNKLYFQDGAGTEHEIAFV